MLTISLNKEHEVQKQVGHIQAYAPLEHIPLPEGLKLRPYQIRAVQLIDKFLKEPLLVGATPVKGIYNASDIGTGKTVMTIASLNVQQADRFICVVPPSLLYNWKAEIEKWSTLEDKRILIVKKQKDLEKATEANIIISSPGMLQQAELLSYILRIPLHSFILDEAVNIKNEKTILSKVIRKYFVSKIKHFYFISGTPMPKNLNDLWNPYNILDKTIGTRDQFLGRHCYVTETQIYIPRARRWVVTKEYSGSRNIELLTAHTNSRFYFKVKTEEAGKDIPEMNWVEVQVPRDELKPTRLTLAHRKLYQEHLGYRENALEELKENYHPAKEQKLRLSQARALLDAIKSLAHERIPYIVNFIKDKVESGEAVVVFAWHRQTISRIENELLQAGIKLTVVTGATTPKAREEAKIGFQEGKYDVFIGQIRACGTGMTLTRAKICVMAELSWSPADNAQAAGRIRRIGQKFPTFCYYFTTPDTADFKFIQKLASKAARSNEATGTDLEKLSITKTWKDKKLDK